MTSDDEARMQWLKLSARPGYRLSVGEGIAELSLAAGSQLPDHFEDTTVEGVLDQARTAHPPPIPA